MPSKREQNSSHQPKLLLIAEDDEGEFDQVILQTWKEEGFDVSYLPLSEIHSKFECTQLLQHCGKSLGPGEKYAVIGMSPFRACR